jgi:hypothetical protein
MCLWMEMRLLDGSSSGINKGKGWSIEKCGGGRKCVVRHGEWSEGMASRS